MANYTEHYQLHQWEPEDSFLRTDFNEDHEKIDTALNGLAEQNAALEAALALCGNCQMEVVPYTGSGTYGIGKYTRISFTYKPQVFFIMGDNAMLMGYSVTSDYVIACKNSDSSGYSVGSGSCSWDGNSLLLENNAAARYQMNSKSKSYCALGLRVKSA